MSSKLEEVYSNISNKIVSSKYKGLIEKMQNVENTINLVGKKYTKIFLIGILFNKTYIY